MGEKPRLKQVVTSVIAALFGVQSQRNRERDFGYDSPAIYIITGVIMIGLVIGALLVIVSWLT
ncbi:MULTISPECIES: DUF2970 domain-containing protein [Salinivibrio]|jgi:Protein of unknown function (DUF2970).|uniref:DUF2970 domain-containing protein n=1 Tax=Salinivibrio costicola subsp. alcaliphilus TaxID=272773 RepID=A0ABX3KV75_SALCS|nr:MULTISPECIES: DUF2970 domain-containing protein [Salinivibrio]NUY55273.1 DUF2970 domain-containing protein [Salinivibrio sp. EAGSL]OOE97609.1 hypothetical protein BZG77_08295 [Salinivibrio sp. IB643]OOF03670.1 hypothetical protein BZG80_09515 [Salinivibrio sp. MA440]OOF07316.1 hypothetical protein BZG81_01025 [Salinivibrio sp. MA607]OOF35360.1 hypothetical protein BZJ21_01210 [Salinivibrio costicola subsp. alcaliphilus]